MIRLPRLNVLRRAAGKSANGWRTRGLGSSVGATAARSIGVLAAVGTSVLLARGLGADVRGELAVIVAWASIVVQIATLGLTSSLPYHIALHEGAAAGLLVRAARLCFGALALVVMCAAAWTALSPMPTGLSLAGVVEVGIASGAGLLLLLLQSAALGLRRVALFAWSDVWARVAGGALVGAFIFLASPSVLLAVLALSAGSLCGAALVASRLRMQLHQCNARPAVSIQSELGYGARAWVVCAAGMLPMRVLTVVMGYRADESQVAVFAVALGVVETTAAVLCAIPQSRIAHMTHDVSAGAGSRRELATVGALMSLASVMCCAVVWVAAPVIMPVVYGRDFAATGGALRLMAPVIVGIPLAAVFQGLLAARGMPWISVLGPVTACVAVVAGLVMGYGRSVEQSSVIAAASAGCFLLGSALGLLIDSARRTPAAKAVAPVAARAGDPGCVTGQGGMA